MLLPALLPAPLLPLLLLLLSCGPRPTLTQSGYPSYQQQQQPQLTSADLQRFTSAISTMAHAMDSMAIQFIDMQKQIDYLMERDRLCQSESSVNVQRVGVPPTIANDLNTNNLNPFDNTKPSASKPLPPYSTTTTTRKPYTRPTTTAPAPANNKGCGYQFERVGDECYYVSTRDYHRANWQVSYESCQKKGAVLASLDTPQKFAQLARYLSNAAPTASYRFWLGGIYPGIEWRWLYSGEKIDLQKSMWTISNSNSIYGARSQARYVSNLFDLSTDNPELKTMLRNITRAINRERSKAGAPTPIVGQQTTETNGTLRGAESTNSQQSGENGFDVLKRQAFMSSSLYGTNPEKRSETTSPLLSLINSSLKEENSQVASREYRQVRDDNGDPWSVSYGRCLIFQSVTNERTFKFAADQCPYDQYYICQETNDI